MKTRTAKMAPATTIELQSSTVSFCISMRRGPAQEVQKFADQIASEVAKSYSKTPESILRQLMTQFELSALSKSPRCWPSAHRAADGCARAPQLPRRWVACAIHAAWIAIHTTASRPGRRPTLRSMFAAAASVAPELRRCRAQARGQAFLRWCMAISGACCAAAKGAQAAQNRAMFCFTNAGLH